jgi:hypothetical protein
MSNMLTKRGSSSLATLGNLASDIGAMQQGIPSGGGDPYLRMGRDGVWIYGADATEVEEGSRWAVNPLSLEHGYVCWSDRKDGKQNDKLGEVMVPSGQPLPANLPDHGFPWKHQVGFAIVCVSGEDTGVQSRYFATSKGGLDAIKEEVLNPLGAQIAAEQRKGPLTEQSPIVPVFELEHSSYNHKTYGKIYTPVFKFVGWASLSDQTFEEPEAEAAPEPAPQPRRNGGAAAPAPTNAATRAAGGAEAPRTRTRGRA